MRTTIKTKWLDKSLASCCATFCCSAYGVCPFLLAAAAPKASLSLSRSLRDTTLYIYIYIYARCMNFVPATRHTRHTSTVLALMPVSSHMREVSNPTDPRHGNAHMPHTHTYKLRQQTHTHTCTPNFQRTHPTPFAFPNKPLIRKVYLTRYSTNKN